MMIREIPLERSGLPQRRPIGRGSAYLTPARLIILSLLLFATALALLYLWQSWQWVYWLNKLHQAQVELEALQAENGYLKLEVSQAFSLKRIEAIATERLGMFRPSPHYLVVPPLRP